MSRRVANSLLIVFAAISFLTLGRAPALVRFRTRDLEIQLSITQPSTEST